MVIQFIDNSLNFNVLVNVRVEVDGKVRGKVPSFLVNGPLNSAIR